ncbi:hypothetical protein SAOR_16560 [Salinisphaera orenii MK-B5]|uniref:Peptidase M15A C-terminal domain-containing protein n=2 Tax=Salinisphaera orenii TaxID=856731 RepID=A0A423PEM4_9GAMM|nr:hypothetical protein SAOR_16560 [Salinisphaera orenii MK-B5]ROO27480.1 hypothetical protein SAHL_11465 [Salinisphaera halophila YIM 95161]
MHRVRTLCLVLALVAGAAIAPAAEARDAPPSRFTVHAGDQREGGDVLAAFVMPGRTLPIRATGLAAGQAAVLQTGGRGRITGVPGSRAWRWRAPERPGLYPLVVHAEGGTAEVRLNVFVKTPVDHARRTLDGFRIGRYEPQPQAGRPDTAPPAGLIRVTPANRDTRLSPHFRLDQFLCHQQPEHWPKYVLVQPRLLDKLERLHGALAEAGFPLDTITVMSGYRTPWYNADIGNTTRYSRHLFGGAADIYVDADGDDRMDDLNGDGTVDTRDAAWLADLVETVNAAHPELIGGLSAYPANAHHGPFVHIDARGYRARW